MKKTKKVCKQCKVFVETDKCQLCGGTQFSENWKGRIILLDPERSEIGKKLNLKQKGIYAIKV